MQELTEIQINKLGDFKEQLASIKTNINVANKELEATLEKTRLANDIFAAKKKDLDNKIAVLEEKASSTQLFIDSENKRLEQESAKLVADKIEFTKYETDTREQLDVLSTQINKDRLSTEDYLSKLRKEINSSEKELSLIRELISEAETKHQEKLNDIKFQEGNYDFISSELSKLEDERDEKVAMFKKYIEIKQNELDELDRQIQIDSLKTIEAREGMEFREAELARKHKQIEVIYNRTKRAWAIMYPNQSLDNVIKI